MKISTFDRIERMHRTAIPGTSVSTNTNRSTARSSHRYFNVPGAEWWSSTVDWLVAPLTRSVNLRNEAARPSRGPITVEEGRPASYLALPKTTSTIAGRSIGDVVIASLVARIEIADRWLCREGVVIAERLASSGSDKGPRRRLLRFAVGNFSGVLQTRRGLVSRACTVIVRARSFDIDKFSWNMYREKLKFW